MGRAKIIPQNDTLLLPYQKRWILDGSRIKLMEKSRQIGISWASAYSLVRRKCTTGARYDAWVSSRDEIQAKLFQSFGLKYQGLQSFFRLSMSVIVVLQNFLNLKVLLKMLFS